MTIIAMLAAATCLAVSEGNGEFKTTLGECAPAPMPAPQPRPATVDVVIDPTLPAARVSLEPWPSGPAAGALVQLIEGGAPRSLPLSLGSWRLRVEPLGIDGHEDSGWTLDEDDPTRIRFLRRLPFEPCREALRQTAGGDWAPGWENDLSLHHKERNWYAFRDDLRRLGISDGEAPAACAFVRSAELHVTPSEPVLLSRACLLVGEAVYVAACESSALPQLRKATAAGAAGTPEVTNKVLPESQPVRVQLRLDRPPPTHTRVSFDLVSSLDSVNEGHAEAAWEPLASGDLTQAIPLARGKWQVSFWSTPDRDPQNALTNFAWDVDPEWSATHGSNVVVLRRNLDAQLAECFANVDRRCKQQNDSSFWNRLRKTARAEDHEQFFEILRECKAPVPPECRRFPKGELAHLTFSVLPRRTLAQATAPLASPDGSGSTGGPRLDGRSLGGTLEQDAEQLVEILGEIVVEKAEGQALALVQDRLADLACRRLLLTRPMASRLFGPASVDALFKNATDEIKLLPSACAVLQQIRLADIANPGTRKGFLRAVVADLIAFGVERVGSIAIHRLMNDLIAAAALKKVQAGANADTSEDLLRAAEIDNLGNLRLLEQFDPAASKVDRAGLAGTGEELARLADMVLAIGIDLIRQASINDRAPKLEPMVLIARLATSLADDRFTTLIETARKYEALDIADGMQALQLAFAAIGECHRTGSCDARAVVGFLGRPNDYFDFAIKRSDLDRIRRGWPHLELFVSDVLSLLRPARDLTPQARTRLAIKIAFDIIDHLTGVTGASAQAMYAASLISSARKIAEAVEAEDSPAAFAAFSSLLDKALQPSKFLDAKTSTGWFGRRALEAARTGRNTFLWTVGDPTDSARTSRGMKKFAAVASAFATWTGPASGGKPDDARAARKKSISSVVDAATARDSRDGDVIFGLSGSLGAELPFVSRPFRNTGVSLPLSISLETVPFIDGKIGLLFGVSPIDIGRYVSLQDGRIEKLDWLQAFSPSLTAGLRFQGGVPLFTGFRVRYKPALPSQGEGAGGSTSFSLVLGAHVPLFDFN